MSALGWSFFVLSSEYKKFLLENRKESYSAVALLEKELDLERVNKQLDEVNLFIDAVTAHKATL